MLACSHCGGNDSHLNSDKFTVHHTIFGCPYYQSVVDTASTAADGDKNNEVISSCSHTKNDNGNTVLPLVSQSQSTQLFKEAQRILTEQPIRELQYSWQISAVKQTNNNYQVEKIVLGSQQIEVWYKSELPTDLACMSVVYFCEHCLNPQKFDISMQRHIEKCPYRHPPGTEIYRHDSLSVFEIDGADNRQYCQNLCRMAKFFIHHKTLVEGVKNFVFYVLTFEDDDGCHLVGYFSKEKESLMNYNLSCLLVFPHHMRKGYGYFLIDLSYALTALDGSIGTPERPLSDSGLLSYRKYWTRVVLSYMQSRSEVSIREISHDTRIHPNDIVSTLLSLELIKYWRGQYMVIMDRRLIEAGLSKSSGVRPVNMKKLLWKP